MRVIIAPDSFKGTLASPLVARALAAGWREIRPGDTVVELPLADGGEGTVAVLRAARPGSQWIAERVGGPDGVRIDAGWLLLPDGTAAVELAMAAGLPQLARPAPLQASTTGVGELLRAAATHPATRRIVVGLGGSASTDGGTGALRALGARFLDAKGSELPAGGGALDRLARAEPTLVPPPPGGVSCLVDVTAPLLGPLGAAAQFGPQKGATAADVARLEAGLTRLAQVLGGDPDQPGAGAAGGAGFGLATWWSATLDPGAATVAAIAGLPAALDGADFVVTGEGRYDSQSSQGKLVGHVLDTARAAQVPACVVAGSLAAPVPEHVVMSADLVGLAGDPADALARPAEWLATAGRHLAAAAAKPS